MMLSGRHTIFELREPSEFLPSMRSNSATAIGYSALLETPFSLTQRK